MASPVHGVVVRRRREGLAEAFKRVQGRYAWYWNVGHSSSGHVASAGATKGRSPRQAEEAAEPACRNPSALSGRQREESRQRRHQVRGWAKKGRRHGHGRIATVSKKAKTFRLSAVFPSVPGFPPGFPKRIAIEFQRRCALIPLIRRATSALKSGSGRTSIAFWYTSARMLSGNSDDRGILAP